MKRIIVAHLLFLIGIAFAQPPNIVFIYADDMGWTGTSVEMIEGKPETKSDFYQTPNLEKLAARGKVFSQAYSPGAMCTPSRAAVLTGKTPAELHITTPGSGKSDTTNKVITPNSASQLPDNLPTIGTMLKAEGYATALLGKWHIGRSDHAGLFGFDQHDGATSNEDRGTTADPKEIFSLTARGIEFMKQHAHAGTPFYLQLSHYAVHSPIQSRPESSARFDELKPGRIHQTTDYAGMTWDLDASLSQIFDALDQLEIADNTYIVFMSDNGAGGNQRKQGNAPLNAGKGSLYEGGIRVPLIIAGPGIEAGYCSEPVSGTDLFSTFATWSGTSAESLESADLTPLLTGKPESFVRARALLFHNPHYGKNRSKNPQTALIVGNYKLVRNLENSTHQLFNLSTDLGEQSDLSQKKPDVLKKLIGIMNERLNEVDAQLPIENPDYTPSENEKPRRKRT